MKKTVIAAVFLLFGLDLVYHRQDSGGGADEISKLPEGSRPV